MNQRVYVPDADCIRKTGAGYLRSRWIALLITGFAMGLLFALHSLLLYLSNLRGSILEHNAALSAVLILLPMLGFGLYLYKDFMFRLTAYRWQDGDLVKGVIGPVNSSVVQEIVAGTASMAVLSSLVSAPDAMLCGCTSARLMSIRARILCNMNPDFAALTFDTDQYKKKRYPQPQRIRETKHHVVYRCADGKTLKLLKAYDMGPYKTDGKDHTTAGDTFKTLAILWLAALLIFSADYLYARSVTGTVEVNQTAAAEQLRLLEDYGYQVDEGGAAKSVGEHAAHLTLHHDRMGNLSYFSSDLYFTAGDSSARPIAQLLLTDLGAQFSPQDQEAFLTALDQFLSGDFSRPLTITAQNRDTELHLVPDGNTYFRIYNYR